MEVAGVAVAVEPEANRAKGPSRVSMDASAAVEVGAQAAEAVVAVRSRT